MKTTEPHLTDSELLRALDGEHRSIGSRGSELHLAGCETCRTRLEKIRSSMTTAVQEYRDAFDPSLPLASDSRAELQARLMAESEALPATRLRKLVAIFEAPAWTYVAAVLAVGAMWVALRYSPIRQTGTSQIESADAAGPLIPNARLTPGAVGTVTLSQLCTDGAGMERRAPSSVQHAVFHEYGMDGAPSQEYEVDHLITPALGGTDDIRNLWPEPYSPDWNAHVKDELEDRLHDLVCQGKLDLPTAQHDIATNWIAAYKKYFHTDRPLFRDSSVIPDRRKTPAS